MEDLDEEIVEAFDQLISTKSRDHSNMDAVALKQVLMVHQPSMVMAAQNSAQAESEDLQTEARTAGTEDRDHSSA